jgi:glycosyltransferase involved in cell wall biosynthesis
MLPRVLILQPALPHYREAFFNALAERFASLTVLYGHATAARSHHAVTQAREFEAIPVRHTEIGPVWWMPTIWSAPDPARFDVAVVSWNSRYIHLVPGLLRARRRSIATVAWGHGYSKQERPWRRMYRDLVASGAHVVLTYNDAAAQALVERGFDPRRVAVAGNAIDQGAIQAARQRWLEVPHTLRSWQESNAVIGRRVALYVSRLLYPRDLTILLEAWCSVLAQVPDGLLLVVGDGPARVKLEELTLQLGIDHAVRYLGAIYDEDRLAPLFLTASVFAFPRRIGLSLHHALGYGLPVVAFDNAVRHGPEFTILRHGVNGLLVREDDREALAATLVNLLLNPERAREMGATGRQMVQGECSLAAMVDGFSRGVDRAVEVAR